MAPAWTCGLDDPGAARRRWASAQYEELLRRDRAPRHGGHPVRQRRVPGRQALARVLRQRDDQLRPRAVPRSLRRPRAAAPSAPELDGDDRPRQRPLLGLRLQDPGEHGPQPPRPRRLRARLLRAVHAGHGGQPRPRRPSLHHEPHHAVPGAGADHDRRGLRGRHPRPVGRRHPAHRRHPGRGGVVRVRGDAALLARALRRRCASRTR